MSEKISLDSSEAFYIITISYANTKNDDMSVYDKWHFCIEANLRPRTLG